VPPPPSRSRPPYHAPPDYPFTKQRRGAPDRRHQGGGAIVVEGEAGGRAFGQVCRGRIDDRVGKPADPAHQRQSPVTQRVELGQAARLEARRDEDDIGAGIDQVRQTFIIADRNPDPSSIPFRRSCESLLEITVSRAEQRELPAARDEVRQPREGEVEAFLRGQAADDPEQRRAVDRLEPETALQASLRRLLAGDRVLCLVRPRQDRVAPRVPYSHIDAVQDPGQNIGTGTQQPVEAPAISRGLDLARVSRTDGGQAIRVEQSGLDEGHHAVKLDPVDREKLGWQGQL